MNSIIEKLEKCDAKEVKRAFKELLNDYLTPAYGSISKRDFDILLFSELQKLKIIGKNPEIYEIVSDLKVTRAKARNLLYETKLRQTSTADLDEELKQLLKKPTFLKDNDKICIEIDNPYLIDYLRARLRRLNHITDGSFSQELVRLPPDAFLDLFDSCLPEESKEEIKRVFVGLGAINDHSFKGIMKGVLKNIGKRVAGGAGDILVENYLGPIIDGSVDALGELFKGWFKDQHNE